jgi:hypothetical protein
VSRRAATLAVVLVIAGSAVAGALLGFRDDYPDAASAEDHVRSVQLQYCHQRVRDVRCTSRQELWHCVYAGGTTDFAKDDGGHPEVQVIC